MHECMHAYAHTCLHASWHMNRHNYGSREKMKHGQTESCGSVNKNTYTNVLICFCMFKIVVEKSKQTKNWTTISWSYHQRGLEYDEHCGITRSEVRRCDTGRGQVFQGLWPSPMLASFGCSLDMSKPSPRLWMTHQLLPTSHALVNQ